MADFADVLARLDQVTDGTSLDAYRSTVARALADAVQGDRLAEAIVAYVEKVETWRGSPSELLAALAPWRPDDGRNWPKSARGLSRAVKRLAVPLRTQGVDARHGREHAGRYVTLARLAGRGDDGRGRVGCVGCFRSTRFPLLLLFSKQEQMWSRNYRHDRHDRRNRHAPSTSWPQRTEVAC